MTQDWKPADTAPYGKTILVRNKVMEKPVRATRGYAPNGVVNPDTTLFTTAWTPDKYFPIPAGQLVCPTEWTELNEAI